MNDGERMCDFSEHNGLVVGGTIFKHKDIHKVTWTSPDGKTKPQIDHIIINGKWRSSLQDVRAYRGADCASDHTLVLGVISLKLRKTRKGQQRGRLFDSDKDASGNITGEDGKRKTWKEHFEAVLNRPDPEMHQTLQLQRNP